jgi:hypothetical protein
MEAHPMINSEHPASSCKDVAALAISVIDQHIEDGQQPEIGNIGMDHDTGRSSPSKPSLTANQPALVRRARYKINKFVGRLVDITQT